MDQFLPQFVFVEVKEAKLEVVHFPCAVKINLVEEKSIVCERYLEPHLTHPLDKLSEVETAAEVFVHGPEALSESLVLLNDPEISVLDQLICPCKLVRRRNERHSFERFQKL
jgi:hypothetical protein